MSIDPETAQLLGELKQHAVTQSDDMKEIKESIKHTNDHIGKLYEKNHQVERKVDKSHSRLDAHEGSFRLFKWIVGLILAAYGTIAAFFK